jgi:hypothetical protein
MTFAVLAVANVVALSMARHVPWPWRRILYVTVVIVGPLAIGGMLYDLIAP